MNISPKRFLHPFFMLGLLVFLFTQTSVYAHETQNEDVRNENVEGSLRALDRVGSKANFPTPSDFDRASSAGWLADPGAGGNVDDAVKREREEINEQHESHDWEERKHGRDILKASDDTKAEEDARKEKLAKLDRAGLDRARIQSQQAIDYFNKMNGPSDKWTPEQNEHYNQLVYRNAALNEPTAAESKEAERHEQVRRDVHNQIKSAAYNMGKMTDDEVRERLEAAQTADAATKTWRDFTFTGQMYSHVHQDIHNQHEIGIKANSMIMAAQLYLRQPGLTVEQKKIAQQILNTNKMVRGHAADAISKDLALVALGVTADAGMMGVGKLISKTVGFFGKIIGGGGTEAASAGGAKAAGAGAAGEGAGQASAKAAGTEAGGQAGAKVAGQEAGGQAGAKAAGTEGGTTAGANAAGQEAGQSGGKLPSQMSASEAQAYQDGLSNKAITNVKDAGQKIADIAKDKSVAMPPEAGAAAAETKAIEGSVKNLTQAEINKLFEKGANLTPNQVIQKAELLKQGYNPAAGGGASGAAGATPQGFKPPPGWSEGATVAGGQQASGATQAFKGTLPLPGQGAGTAAGGTTQAFNGAITLPHPAPTAAASGGTTQAFKGVLPIPGGGGATAASEAATVSGNLTGNTAGGATQGFNKVLPLPNSAQGVAPGVNPGGVASEAPTAVGNLTGSSGGSTQAFNKVLPLPKK